jgi:hypothetical protein
MGGAKGGIAGSVTISYGLVVVVIVRESGRSSIPQTIVAID